MADQLTRRCPQGHSGRPRVQSGAIWIGALALASLALTLALSAARSAEPPRVEKAANPHWRPEACVQCHQLQSNGRPSGPPRNNADELCLGCHDGRRAPAELHPVGVRPVNARPKAATWPLVGGRLGCLTCHDIKQACLGAESGKTTTADPVRTAGRPALNPMFLRVPQAARVLVTFCENCHNPDNYLKVSPHAMVKTEGEATQIIPAKCLMCHQKAPDRNVKLRTGQADLRQDQAALCGNCHRPHSDYANPSHLGRTIKPAMTAYIRKREIGVLAAQMKAEAAGKPAGKAAASQPAEGSDLPLPLDGAGRIMCTTCHNPHQQQTFVADSILNYGAMRQVAPGKVLAGERLQQMCADCHEASGWPGSK